MLLECNGCALLSEAAGTSSAEWDGEAAFGWTSEIRNTEHTSPVLCGLQSSPSAVCAQLKASDGVQLCRTSACTLHASTACCGADFPQLELEAFSASRSPNRPSSSPLEKWGQERSPCRMSFTLAKTFRTAPRAGRRGGERKNIFPSWHSSPYWTSLRISGPCEAVMGAVGLRTEKERAESTAICRGGAGCKGNSHVHHTAVCAFAHGSGVPIQACTRRGQALGKLVVAAQCSGRHVAE